jgi:hypothetical protein
MLPKEQFISLIATDLRDQIQTLSSNDDFIKGIIKCLKERSTPPLRTALSDWTLDDGIILFKNKVFVPNNKDIRRSIIAETHESPVSGHPGHLKTLYLLKEQFYWPGRFITELMSTEHDEQPTELTYPTTIRLVLASDNSDKENHIPDI